MLLPLTPYTPPANNAPPPSTSPHTTTPRFRLFVVGRCWPTLLCRRTCRHPPSCGFVCTTSHPLAVVLQLLLSDDDDASSLDAPPASVCTARLLFPSRRDDEIHTRKKSFACIAIVKYRPVGTGVCCCFAAAAAAAAAAAVAVFLDTKGRPPPDVLRCVDMMIKNLQGLTLTCGDAKQVHSHRPRIHCCHSFIPPGCRERCSSCPCSASLGCAVHTASLRPTCLRRRRRSQPAVFSNKHAINRGRGQSKWERERQRETERARAETARNAETTSPRNGTISGMHCHEWCSVVALTHDRPLQTARLPPSPVDQTH
jgi:hypothetical protein